VKRVYTIKIFDQDFSIKTDADENRVHELAAYLQQRFDRIKAAAHNASRPDQMALTLLDVANDFFEVRDLLSEVKSEVESRSNQMISRIESISPMEV